MAQATLPLPCSAAAAPKDHKPHQLWCASHQPQICRSGLCRPGWPAKDAWAQPALPFDAQGMTACRGALHLCTCSAKASAQALQAAHCQAQSSSAWPAEQERACGGRCSSATSECAIVVILAVVVLAQISPLRL